MYDKSQLIGPPWGGWDESGPSIWLPKNSFKQAQGWLINKQKLQSFPLLSTFPSPPDGNAWQGAVTFQDVVGSYHTVVVTKDHVFFVNADGTYTSLGTTESNSFQEFSLEVFLNKVFFANGNAGHVMFVDGSNFLGDAGDVPGTCLYIGKLDSSLILLNLLESSKPFPLSVRWSGVNNPTEWDATVDVTAGSNIISEAEDSITGFANQKGQGVIYRKQGITIMSPTGQLFPRFSFNSFESGPTGVGNNFPGSLANFGDESVFAAEDDIYLFSLSTPQPIGTKSKKSIYKDLNNQINNPHAMMVGSLGSGIDYKSYWLGIPLIGGITSLWIYHFDSQSWMNEQFPTGDLTWMGKVATS